MAIFNSYVKLPEGISCFNMFFSFLLMNIQQSPQLYTGDFDVKNQGQCYIPNMDY